MSSSKVVRAFLFAALLAADASAAPVTYLSSAAVSELYYTSNSTYTVNMSGSSSTSGANSAASINNADQYGVRSGSVSSTLSAAQLRVGSRVSNGITPFVNAVTSVGIVGDSFRTQSVNNEPFIWNDQSATFALTIDGISGLTGSSVFSNEGFLSLYILKPGALDGSLYHYSGGSYGLLVGPALTNGLIRQFVYGLTPSSTTYLDVSDPNYGDRPVDGVLNPLTPQTVNATFTPDGDFDWILMLQAENSVGGADVTSSAFVDFTHTVDIDYLAPADASTYSASGIFPGTRALNPNVIPEPAPSILLAIGLMAVRLQGRRRRSRSMFLAQ